MSQLRLANMIRSSAPTVVERMGDRATSFEEKYWDPFISAHGEVSVPDLDRWSEYETKRTESAAEGKTSWLTDERPWWNPGTVEEQAQDVAEEQAAKKMYLSAPREDYLAQVPATASARIPAMLEQMAASPDKPDQVASEMILQAGSIATATTKANEKDRAKVDAAATLIGKAGVYGAIAGAVIKGMLVLDKLIDGGPSAEEIEAAWKDAYRRFVEASNKLIAAGLPPVYNLPRAYIVHPEIAVGDKLGSINYLGDAAEANTSKMLSLPGDLKTPIQRVWQLTLENRNKPIVQKMMAALPTRDFQTRDVVMTDELVLQVGIPVAVALGTDVAGFLRRLYVQTPSWQTRPELFLPDSTGVTSNALQIQMGLLAKKAMQVYDAEMAKRAASSMRNHALAIAGIAVVGGGLYWYWKK